jgi:hypothetical protein
LGIITIQLFSIVLAIGTNGWLFYLAQIVFMVTLGASSIAVWLIGPIVKQSGFTLLLCVMAATSCITLAVVNLLPSSPSPRSHRTTNGTAT